MDSRSLIPRILLFGGGIALAWALVPGNGEASSTAWRSLNAASAAYLQQGAGFVSATATGGGTRALPTSVLPNGTVGLQCSTDTAVGSPPTCSTNSASPRCSAHCDNAQRCSAFAVTTTGGFATCSTQGGGPTTQCSVLQPNINPAGPSQCSAFGGVPGSTIQCSIMFPGNAQKCSAANPAQFPNNQCSTFFFGGAVGGTLQCSVIKGAGPPKNYCSVGNAVPGGFVPKQCSTFAQVSQCSILPGNKGVCTTFAPAPAGSCSIFAGGSTCSVIGGANGAICVQ